MDPIPGSKEAYENSQPKTATEEAMLKLKGAIEAATRDYNKLSLFSFRSRFYLQGIIKALTLVFAMLHELHHKYDNSNGEWN